MYALDANGLAELRRRGNLLEELTAPGSAFEEARVATYDVLFPGLNAIDQGVSRERWSRPTPEFAFSHFFWHELDALLLRAEGAKGNPNDPAALPVLSRWHGAVWRLIVELDWGHCRGSRLLYAAASVFPGGDADGPERFRILRNFLAEDLAAALAMADAAGGLIEPQRSISPPNGVTNPSPPPRRQTAGFRVVYWDRIEAYTFTTKQSQIVQLLWTRWEQGTHYATIAELLEAAELMPDVANESKIPEGKPPSDSKRLRDVFKGHPNWDTLIVPASPSLGPGAKGLYRLAE